MSATERGLLKERRVMGNQNTVNMNQNNPIIDD